MNSAFRQLLLISACLLTVQCSLFKTSCESLAQNSGASGGSDTLTPFIVKASWLKFGVFDGRILAKDIRRTQSRSLTLYHEEQEAEEHLVVRTIPGKYRIKYALQSPEELLQLEYDIEGVFFVRREFEGVQVQLRQSAENVLRFHIAKGGRTTEYTAERLWLGLIKIPEAERGYVIAMLNRLCPETHVSLLFNEAVAGLKRLSLSPVQLEISKVRALVALLEDESFAVRQQADRQLRAFGRPLIGFLENVDYSDLSPEQRTRLQLIVKKYKVVERDSVATIITTLKWNPQLWQVFANQKQDSVLAANSVRRFQQLLGTGESSQNAESVTASQPVLLQLR